MKRTKTPIDLYIFKISNNNLADTPNIYQTVWPVRGNKVTNKKLKTNLDHPYNNNMYLPTEVGST